MIGKYTQMEELFLDIKNQLIKERELILEKKELDKFDIKKLRHLEKLIYTPKLDRDIESRAMNYIFKMADKFS